MEAPLLQISTRVGGVILERDVHCLCVLNEDRAAGCEALKACHAQGDEKVLQALPSRP